MVHQGYDINIGKRIKSYTIQKKLGSGGSACVYLSQNHLNEYTAIKILHPNIAHLEGQRFFLQEAQILQELKHHQYILPILDYGESEGTPYIVTEYIPGGTLRKWINHPHPVAIEEILTVLFQIGEAVHAAHLHNIVHNDLKPENILFNKRNEAVLADFGISVRLGERKKIFSRHRGTYAYMAPEQFDGVCAKEGDQYSLGCVAYELLTGKHPFERFLSFNPYDFEIMKERHKNAKPPSPNELNNAVPVHIGQAILKAMAKVPLDRHADIAAFIRALQSLKLLSAQPTYHFTCSLDTPPPYESTLERLPSPVVSPNSAMASISQEREVRKIGRNYNALRYSSHRNQSGQMLPKNLDKEQFRHTDHAIPDVLSISPEKLGVTTDRSTPNGRTSPLQTRNLQLMPELVALLSPSLKNLGLELCPKIQRDPITLKDWEYTAIATDELVSTSIQGGCTPQHALVHLPGKFLTNDRYVNDLSTILALFPQWILIIFSDTSTDLAPAIERLIEREGNVRKMNIVIVKRGHIKELKNTTDISIQKDLIMKYLKLEHLLLRAREVESIDTGTIEEFTEYFLKNTHDIQDFLKYFGSEDLQKVLLGKDITGDGVPHIIAHNIIHRLNEPPHQPGSTGHTLLGEFLCILLQKRNFVSPLNEIAQKVRRVIRKYGLGLPTCPHCKP